MKNIYIGLKTAFCVALSITLLSLAACGEDDKYESYGLTLSDYSYTFSMDGGELTIKVTTAYPEEWSMEYDNTAAQEWLTESARDAASVTLSAAPNFTGEPREAKLTFRAGTLSEQVTITQQTEPAAFHILDNMLAVSSNGEYIVTFDRDESQTIIIYTLNTRTHEKKEVVRTTEVITTIHAVSDDGKIMIGSMEAGGMDDGFYIMNGEIKRPAAPEGINGYLAMKDMSADGSIIVGSGMVQRGPWDFYYSPIKWVNFEPVILDAPETSRLKSYGDYFPIESFVAETVSPDGKYIIGRVVDEDNIALYWKDDQWKWMGEIVEKEVTYTNMWGAEITETKEFVSRIGPSYAGKISSNSRYGAVTFEAWGQMIMGPGKVGVPALFDFQTEEMVAVIDDIIEIGPYGGMSLFASNEGDFCYSTTPLMGTPLETFYRKSDGTVVSARSYVESMFGLSIGQQVQITRLVPNEVVIGAFNHPAGTNVPFYARIKTAE